MSDTPNGQQQQGGEAAPPAAAAAAAGETAAADTPKKTARVSFKVSGGTQFALDVEEDWSVRTLKEKCQEKTAIPVAAQRLIYKGRILKDDDLISSQGLKDGHIMHLVKSVAAAAATNAQQQQPQQQQQQPTATPAAAVPPPAGAAGECGGGPPLDSFLQSMLSGGGLGGMGAAGGMGGGAPMGGAPPMGFPMGGPEMLQMMQSPFFQQAMDSLMQNPQTFRTLVESVPALRPMLPMMQGLLDNPERMRAMFNPQMMQASIQMQQAMQQMRGPQQDGAAADPAAAAAGGAPGGAPPFFAALQAATAGMAPPAAGGAGAPSSGGGAPAGGTAAGGGAPNPLGSMGSGNMAFASMLQQAEEMMRTNPELMSQVMQAVMGGGGPAAAFGQGGARPGGAPGGAPSNPLAALGSLGSMGAMFPPAAADTRPPEERFASQLQSLTDMGFIDRDANLAALQETDGDVNAAITRLLERGLGN
ncbi:hypothetical protein Efla_007694 [Eimeria flavescens]